MTTRTVIAVLLFMVVLGAGGYLAYQKYLDIEASVAADNARELQVEQNRSRTTDALIAAGVSPAEADSGFWYITTDQYGNQSVGYYDADLWSQQQATEAQIQDLAKTVGGSQVVNLTSMSEVPPDQLPDNLKFHNALYASPNGPPGTFQKTQAQLEALYENGTASAEDLWELSYMYELQGEYAKRDEVNAASCKLYKMRCTGNIPVVLSGTVVDLSGRPIQGASVMVLSHPELPPVQTDVRGQYSIKLSALAMEKIRVSASKRNFTDGVASTIVAGPGKSAYQMDTIVLTSPIVIVTVDTQKHTVTDPKDTANSDGSFVLHATSSTYQIPAGAIVHRDGSPYLGPVDVYLYEFTRDTVPASLVTLDTFNQVMGYAGNLMQTLGMPFIQFFTPTGEELAVMKSRPMLLTYKIADMQDMLDNYYDRPEGPLTQSQLQTVLAASAGDPDFPITADFLYNNHISTFPAFWVFDSRRGVWDNDGMRLLDAQGTMQAPFYTINDEI
jgi:hypothetical protein